MAACAANEARKGTKRHRDHRFYQKLTENNAGAQSDDDDEGDVAVMQTEANYRCPLSTIEFVKPMRSTACQHVYSEAEIKQWISSRAKERRSAPCPIPGCGKPVSLEGLERALDIEEDMQRYGWSCPPSRAHTTSIVLVCRKKKREERQSAAEQNERSEDEDFD
jgi:hypothetical protein